MVEIFRLSEVYKNLSVRRETYEHSPICEGSYSGGKDDLRCWTLNQKCNRRKEIGVVSSCCRRLGGQV